MVIIACVNILSDRKWSVDAKYYGRSIMKHDLNFNRVLFQMSKRSAC